MKNISLIFILSFVLISGNTFSQESATAKQSPMMIGSVEKIDFQKAPYKEWFDEEFNSYVVDTKTMDIFKSKLNSKDILVYFGSWCSDSRREVPRFIKILDYIGFDYNKISFIALDRKKVAPNYTKNIWDIQYVPTFIILENGKEVGRIIETPEDTLEKDLKKITD